MRSSATRPDPQSVFERPGWRLWCHLKCQRRFSGSYYDAGNAGDVDYARDVGRLPMGFAPKTAPLLLQAFAELESLM